jgi:hypothetical protein
MVRRALALAAVLVALAGHSAVAAPPANDAFPGASLAFDTTVSGTTVEATAQGIDSVVFFSEPPDELATVWYSLTAPATRWTTIDTCGSDLDTQLAIGDAGGRASGTTTRRSAGRTTSAAR